MPAASRKKTSSPALTPRLLLAVLLALAAALGLWKLGAHLISRDRSHRNIDPERPMVALTFDDGPSEQWTPVILDCLEQHDAVATFFEVGSNVDRLPQLVKRAADLGCEIGSHTYDHMDLSTADRTAMERDRELCRKAFRAATGSLPTLLRPPGGAVSGEAKRFYDLPFIGWSLDTEDWRTRDRDAIVAAVQSFGDLDGQVILMHSLYQSSAEAAEILIPWLQQQGYQLVTVSELMRFRCGTEPQPHLYYTVDFFRYGIDPGA